MNGSHGDKDFWSPAEFFHPCDYVLILRVNCIWPLDSELSLVEIIPEHIAAGSILHDH